MTQFSRRDFIRRGAIVGGTAVWAAPMVRTVTPAFGQTLYPPARQDISFVALLLQCGPTWFRAKFAPGAPVECGRNFAVGGCREQLRRGDRGVSNSCPPGVSGAFQADGTLRVTLSSCTLVDYVVKCGKPSDPDDSGCEDLLGATAEGNQPAPPFGSSVTFVACTKGDDASNGGRND